MTDTARAAREKAKNVAKRHEKRGCMHSQGCGLCGCPCAAAAAPLLSDARGALREPSTQPCSLSADSQLRRDPPNALVSAKTTPKDSYHLECRSGVLILKRQPENQILAKIVYVNVFVDRVLDLVNSRQFFGNLDARVYRYLKQLRRKRKSLPSNESLGTKNNADLKSGTTSSGSQLPQDTFNFVENPILSDSFKSFVLNCINDEKPLCDQLFFQLLFYLNVIGLNLLSHLGDFVGKKDELLKLLKDITLDSNFNHTFNPCCCHLDAETRDVCSDTLKRQNKSEDERVRESTPSLINLSCDRLVEEGGEINQSSEKDLDFINDLIPCYEQLSRTDEHLRQQIDEQPHFVEPPLVENSLPERPKSVFGFNYDSEFDSGQFETDSNCFNDAQEADVRQIDVTDTLVTDSPNYSHQNLLNYNTDSAGDYSCFDNAPKADLSQSVVTNTLVTDSSNYSHQNLLNYNTDLKSAFKADYRSSGFNDAPVSLSQSDVTVEDKTPNYSYQNLLNYNADFKCNNGPTSLSQNDVTHAIEEKKISTSHQNLINDYMSIMKQKPSTEEPTDGASSADQSKTLKSALKKTTKGKSGYRVKFDESLNKFFDADYVILVREDTEFDDRFSEICECGDEFCDGRYYEDEESDEDFIISSSCPHNEGCEGCDGGYRDGRDGYRDGYRDGRDGYRDRFRGGRPVYDLPSGSTFEPPLAFVDQDVTLSPPDGYKDGCCSHQFPEPGEADDAHSGAHQRLEREQEPIYSHIDQESKSGSTRGRNFQNNSGLDNPHPDSESGIARTEQEKSDFVPETNTLKLSNLYNQGKISPNSVERNLGLKLRTLNSNQSLKPNSAVRQLFPSSNFILPPQFAQKSPDLEDPSLGNSYATYVPNSSLFHTYTSIEDDEDDDGLLGNNLFRKTIEKNSLRRSLIRYPKDYRKRKCKGRTNSENSLTERIKKLTCDIDDDETLNSNQNEPVQEQHKPYAQETREVSRVQQETQTPPVSEEQSIPKPERTENPEKSTPATSQTSSSSSTMSSTYRKLTDLFSRKSDKNETSSNTETKIQDQHPQYRPVYQTAPDLGNGLNIPNKYTVTKSSATEARKQFLSSLAPLTACVSGNFEPSSPHGHLSLNLSGNRNSVASVDSNVSSEYSLNDIDEALGRTRNEPTKLAPQPDVIAGTPAGNSDAGNNDELALFVQQDAGRIERIKNRYGTGSTNGDSDDDNDDYGFHRRPSVRGIKPRFGSTTEIIQQIQSQLQPPPALDPANIGSHMTWPYYTVEQKSFVTRDTSNTLITTDTGIAYARNHQNKLMAANCAETGPEGISQSIPYTNRYAARSANVVYQQDLVATSRGECPIYRNQRMVQMHLSPLPTSQQVRFSAPSPQFKHEVSSHYLVQTPQAGITSIIHVEQGQQQTIRVPYPASGPSVQVHLQTSRRSDSPLLQNQHSISVRSTQTAAMPYYDPKPPSPYYNYGPLVYVDHPRPNLGNNNFINSNLGSPMSSVTSSPTRSKPETSLCAERGVPEGAASVPMNYQQDALYAVPVPPMSQETVITLTPTSRPNSVYYAMNV